MPEKNNRTRSGDPRHADPEDIGPGAHARLGHCPAYRTDQPRVFQVNPGSLFPAFRRLERLGLVNSEWRATENNRRARYYILSSEGRKKLKSETHEWGRQIAAIARILEA